MPSHIIHPIPPVFDADSRILILGSFPSVKSRESCFFYGHPQNRFWKLLARLRKEDVPSSIEEKKEFLLRNHIAVWDTIHSCSIEGSSDVYPLLSEGTDGRGFSDIAEYAGETASVRFSHRL